MKALEKDRNRRYETANGLAPDVQRYLDDEPVLACPPSAGYRLRRSCGGTPGRCWRPPCCCLALVGGIIGTTWGMLRATGAEAEAVNEAEQKEHALADGAASDAGCQDQLVRGIVAPGPRGACEWPPRSAFRGTQGDPPGRPDPRDAGSCAPKPLPPWSCRTWKSPRNGTAFRRAPLAWPSTPTSSVLPG